MHSVTPHTLSLSLAKAARDQTEGLPSSDCEGRDFLKIFSNLSSREGGEAIMQDDDASSIRELVYDSGDNNICSSSVLVGFTR